MQTVSASWPGRVGFCCPPSVDPLLSYVTRITSVKPLIFASRLFSILNNVRTGRNWLTNIWPLFWMSHRKRILGKMFKTVSIDIYNTLQCTKRFYHLFIIYQLPKLRNILRRKKKKRNKQHCKSRIQYS